MVRYLGVELEDALNIAEKIDLKPKVADDICPTRSETGLTQISCVRPDRARNARSCMPHEPLVGEAKPTCAQQHQAITERHKSALAGHLLSIEDQSWAT